MKKTMLFLILFVYALVASAQLETSIGFKGGINSNTFIGEVKTSIWGNAPVMGGFINLGLADMAQFQFKALYERSLSDFSTDSDDLKVKLGYLDIPLLFKLRISANENIFPYVSLGQSVVYVLIDNSEYRKTPRDTYTNQSNNFKSNNLATLLELDVDFESNLLFFP
jgi:hypothetical protein